MQQFLLKSFWLIALLIVVQVYLVFYGVYRYGVDGNALRLFLVSVTIAVLTFCSLVYGKREMRTTFKFAFPWLIYLLSAVGFVCIAILYQRGFSYFNSPDEYSDVLPQLNVLYDRFIAGEQPYYPLKEISYHPFPVYMPAHWIILSIPKIFHFDVRWIGLIFLFIAIMLYIISYAQKYLSLLQQITILALFLFVLSAFTFKIQHRYLADIFVTLETPIAAYYLVLALGLAIRNLKVIVLGIILCLLSRYTLVFWLPLFAILLWVEKPRQKSFLVWSFVATVLLCFYILPFLMQAPNILADGIAYHNKAAIDEWHGYGNPPISLSQETGIYFAPLLKKWFTGNAEEQVLKARILQALLMIALSVVGAIGYKKFRHRINAFDFGLIMLYLVLVFFYSFGALTYIYYLITQLMLSVVLCSISVANRK